MSAVLEIAPSATRTAFEALAPLFRYPGGGQHLPTSDACLIVAGLHADAAGELRTFAARISELDQATLQSTYTSTFDLAPSCSPYLGTHVFSEDGGDRARLLVGLRASVRSAGGEVDLSELPDHVSEVLRFASRYGDEEWVDLGTLIILPALSKMEELLAPTPNPYRHLLAAARLLASAAFSEGGKA
jgi:nitrate reductase delta subunit